MNSKKTKLWRRCAIGLAAGVLVAGLVTAYPNSPAASVTILVPWSGPELDDFENAVVTPFHDLTGISVDVESTRALDEVLAADTQRGDAPGLAVIQSPRLLAYYANRGMVQPVPTAVAEDLKGDDPRWLPWLQSIPGKQAEYGAFVKVDLNSLLWHGPDTPAALPTDWQDLLDLGTAAGQATPVCLGLASPPVSGWPGTNWIDDVFLHEFPSSQYTAWANGELNWDTSADVRQAWSDWGRILGGGEAVFGGSAGALLTSDGDAGSGMFTSKPGCEFDHESSYAPAAYIGDKGAEPAHKDAGTGTQVPANFGFVPFPAKVSSDADVWETSGDIAAMFTATPAAEQFLEFMVEPTTQLRWIQIPNSGAYSLDRSIEPGYYPDTLSRSIAATLQNPAYTFCFDAADLMPSDMQSAFYQAVLEYVNDPGSGNLTSILASLEAAQERAYSKTADSVTYPVFSCH
jgi:alpha-glucoside transport system substrate-binding protein